MSGILSSGVHRFGRRLLMVLCCVLATLSHEGFAADEPSLYFHGFVGGTQARDGSGVDAVFNSAGSLVVDASGTVFATDGLNHCIRKITPDGTVTTFAGYTGPDGAGTADGKGPDARFRSPAGIALGPDGFLYVTDYGAFTVRKIAPDGTVSTLAGIPDAYGYVDGPRGTAMFNVPSGVAVNKAGEIFVIDSTAVINQPERLIRKITPSGDVSTYAGKAGEWNAHVDGPLASAEFASLAAITFGPDGALYAAETGGNNDVRKITPDGAVSTFAGRWGIGGIDDGTGTQARFMSPVSLAFDPLGNLLVSDAGAREIRRITPQAVVTTIAGSFFNDAGSAYDPVDVDGVDRAARFVMPGGLATGPGGLVYIVEQQTAIKRGIPVSAGVPWITRQPFDREILAGGGTMFVVHAGGYPTSLTFQWQRAANGGSSWSDVTDGPTYSGARTSALTVNAATLAMDGDLFRCLISNPSGTSATRVSTLTVKPRGDTYTFGTLFGPIYYLAATYQDGIRGQALFGAPAGLAVDQLGNVYVSDTGNFVIRKISTDARVTTLAGVAGKPGDFDGVGAGARFGAQNYDNYTTVSGPSGAIMEASGSMLIVDTGACSVRRVTPDGVVTTFVGPVGRNSGSNDGVGLAARFLAPQCIAVGPNGDMYVSDTGNHTIRKITPAGEVITFAGTAGVIGAADGTGAAAQFHSPLGVAVDAGGNVFVADSGNHAIRKITPGGVVTTLAGSSTTPGYKDGPAANALFDTPFGLVFDRNGFLYVTDPARSVIRRIATDGTVSTYCGGTAGGRDGSLRVARVQKPQGITIDRDGNLYFVDAGLSTVRKISASGMVSTVAGNPLCHYLPETMRGATVDDAGNLYVVTLDAILRFGPDYSASVVADVGGSGVAVDRFGTLYSVGGPDFRFDVTTPDAAAVVTFGSSDVFSAVVVDDDLSVYNTNYYTYGIAEANYAYGLALGAGISAPVTNSARGLAMDYSHDFYVSDSSHQVIWKVTPDGVATVLAGIQGVAGSADGAGANATFNTPTGIAVDSTGSVYVADEGNKTIRRVAPNGQVVTIGGTAGQSGIIDGVGANARFENPIGVAVARDGTLFVLDSGTIRVGHPAIPAGPQITSQPLGGAAVAGGAIVVSVSATGDGVSYLWRKSGVPIANNASALSATLTINGATPNDAGTYDCVVSNGGGVVTSQSVAVTVDAAAPADGHVINISTRAVSGPGSRVTIVGFVIGGTAPKRLLLRAVGSTLSGFGIPATDVLADPQIELHDASHGNAVILTNDNWSDNGAANDVQATDSRVGALGFASGDSTSAAALVTLQPGAYTFLASGKNDASGVVLAEAYDADALRTGSTFLNMSARAYSASGGAVAIGGFVVGGSNPRKLLLRAVGPTLATVGISSDELLADPTIEVHDASHGNVVIATNDNWGDNQNAGDIAATAGRVGALPFAATDTTSAALLLSLPPGTYSFVAAGKGNSSGIMLIEVYDAN